MIPVKDAFDAACRFLHDVYGKSAITAIELEEVEQGQESAEWLITLSFLRATEGGGFGFSREYKEFRIKAGTGEVLSMKMRDPHAARRG